MVLVASVADARGPRASIASATSCALDLGTGSADLVVTTTLTNKSSGGRVAEVRGGTIEGTYKPVGVPGNVNITFGTANISDLVALPADVDPDLIITTQFPICEWFELARELNGKASVQYGLDDGEGSTRVVTNRCTDDPDTEDVDEGPIKVADYIDLIEAACAE
jgi:hypothetical protein